MKKYAERFLYQNLSSWFDAELLRNFLLGSYVTCDPIIKSLLMQGEIDLPAVQHYIFNIVEMTKEHGENCVVGLDQISGAVVGCCLAFTSTSKKGGAKQMKTDLIKLFPPDMKAHVDLYEAIFEGVSLTGAKKPLAVVNITVSPLYRNQGIATKMMEELMKTTKKNKLCDCMFVVSTGNGKSSSTQQTGTKGGGGFGGGTAAKNQIPNRELFSSASLKFSPLQKLDYKKINKNPKKYSEENLPNGLLYTGYHTSMTLLKFKFDKSAVSDEEEEDGDNEAMAGADKRDKPKRATKGDQGAGPTLVEGSTGSNARMATPTPQLNRSLHQNSQNSRLSELNR